MPLRMQWDAKKAADNLAKHGVSFDDAATVFRDPLGKIANDPRHSIGEERYVLLGFSDHGQLLAVMFTDREGAVRLISARPATRRERREHEEG